MSNVISLFPASEAVAASPTLSPAEAWSVLLGIVTPFLVAVVNQSKWSARQKRTVAIVVAAAVGVVNVIVQDALDTTNLTWATVLSSLVLVIGASQSAYALLWKPTGVVEKVEDATSKDDGGNGGEFEARAA